VRQGGHTGVVRRDAGIGRGTGAQRGHVDAEDFVLPVDVSASKRYWKRDVIDPWVEVSAEGMITVPDGVGFGYELDRGFVESVQVRQETLTAK